MGDQGMLRVRLEQPGAALCRLPGLLENRGVGELLVEYLARREVTPVQLEDILVELLP